MFRRALRRGVASDVSAIVSLQWAFVVPSFVSTKHVNRSSNSVLFCLFFFRTCDFGPFFVLFVSRTTHPRHHVNAKQTHAFSTMNNTMLSLSNFENGLISSLTLKSRHLFIFNTNIQTLFYNSLKTSVGKHAIIKSENNKTRCIYTCSSIVSIGSLTLQRIKTLLFTSMKNKHKGISRD